MNVEKWVAAAADDSEEKASGSISANVGDLELGFDGSTAQKVGIRFAGLDIPQGAQITAAYIQFTVDESNSSAASLLIRGQDSDSAAAFSTAKFDISSRPVTDASVAWAPAAWTPAGASGAAQQTADISAIVQEIVSRSGWSASNAMAFVISGTGTRTADSFEDSPATAPLLHIEYVLPGGGGSPVAFDAQPDANPAANQIAELAAAGAATGLTASAHDPDAGDSVTYSIDDSRFTIGATSGVITRSNSGTLDFETEPSVTLTVTAHSSDNSAATRQFTLNMLNSQEPVGFNTPADANPATNTISQAATAGTAVGITASARDPDAGDTVSYSVNDSRFAVSSSGVITRSSTGTLNAQNEPSIPLRVTATSSDSSTTTQDYTLAVTGSGGGGGSGTVVEARVAAAANDAEEKASGSISTNVSDLELGFDGSTAQKVGVRFTGLDIPQGAQITAAYIQFTVDERNSDAASLLIRGQDSDSAAAFSAAKFDISSRPVTSASVSWDPAAWTAVGAAGGAQRTTDISAIVQELVDRSGWSPSSAMAFVISGTGRRTADSFEDSPGTAPLLHIEYGGSGGGGGSPVVFDAQPDANPATNQIAELAATGAGTGITASAHDPDAGNSVTYSINDSRFTIGNTSGVITRSNSGTLDFETQPNVTLTVTAHSSDNSTASRQFTLNVQDSPEPVGFNTPADANSGTNTISQSAAQGTAVGITASASDPDAGDDVTYSINDNRFAIGSNGMITRSGTGTLNAQNESSITLRVTATSSDSSTATHDYSLDVTGGGGGGGGLPNALTFVRTTLTSQWSPSSPDPSGLAYISHLGTMLVVDGEVEETAIFAGKNVFEMRPNGSLVSSASTISFSDEPTGIAYNPSNRDIYITDDTGSRGFYVVHPGNDTLYFTSDDTRSFVNTGPFGASDAEGISYDPTRGVIYLASGAEQKIFTISPGPNGRFDGAPSRGGDDVATSFNTLPLGISDPEAVEYDPVHDVLFVPASRTSIAMLTPDGQLLDMFNVSQLNARKLAGMAVAPSSDDPDLTSLYVADRGIDNNSNPNQNDGKIYEFHIDHFDHLV